VTTSWANVPPAPVNDVAVALEPELGKRQSLRLTRGEKGEGRVSASIEHGHRFPPRPRWIHREAVGAEAVDAVPGIGLVPADQRAGVACPLQRRVQGVRSGNHTVRIEDPHPGRCSTCGAGADRQVGKPLVEPRPVLAVLLARQHLAGTRPGQSGEKFDGAIRRAVVTHDDLVTRVGLQHLVQRPKEQRTSWAVLRLTVTTATPAWFSPSPSGQRAGSATSSTPTRHELTGLPTKRQVLKQFLVRDRAGQFTASSDAVLADAGVKAPKIPPRSPPASTYAERLMRTARTESPRVPTFGVRHLRTILAAYEARYNGRRPHRSRQLSPPRPDMGPGKFRTQRRG
jgi:hypothetical protein